jgi:hypothetical protein
MWIVLLFGGFLAVGLRRGRTARADTMVLSGSILVVLAYVAAWKHLL